jgi:DNA-binding transcriptional MerR regulator
MLTPAAVARLANIHPNTVRKYSEQYGALLSARARGEHGDRLYNDEDVATIRTIAALRSSGVPPGEVLARIQAGDAPTVIDVEPQPSTPLHNPTQPLHGDVAPLAVHMAYMSLQSRIEAVERNQARLLSEALRWGMVLGAIGALVAGAFVLWLLYLMA